MPRQSEVERYRIAPEQISFQERYKRLKRIEQMLEAQTLATQQRTRTLKGAWQELNGEFQQLQLNAPQEPTEEYDGMEEGTQPAPDRGWGTINY